MLDRHRLEAVLIRNAAAAIQGVPITTIDMDFYFRRTPANLRKLAAMAKEMEATVMQPFYPASGMFRISRKRDGLQIDFMSEISGVRSFEGLRRRFTAVRFGGVNLRVASLADIIRSKRAAGRPQDAAVLPLLEETREELARQQKGSTGGSQERK